MTARRPPDSGKDARADRLAAALKENLRRRKAQARGRAPEKAADAEPADEPPAEDQDRSN
jgi:hypothetical protein